MQPLARLAYIGLWGHADREGRLKDRPVRLKARILPFDDVDMNALLDEMARHGFIRRYTVGDMPLIHIRTLTEHQQLSPREPDSRLPPPPDQKSTDQAVLEHGQERQEGKGKEGNGKGTEGTRTPSAADVVTLWNQLVTPPIPQVTKLTADRTAKINARLKEFPDLASWRTVITWLNRQDWCRACGTGEHPNWTASLDWLVKNDGQIARYLERASTAMPPAVARTPRVGPTVPGWSQCRSHTPPCTSAAECRQRNLDALRARQTKAEAS